MKKILLILMVMLTIFMTGCFGQNTNTITTMETKSYDITYVDNSYYDFNTGSYYVADGINRTYYDSYATTNRISLASDTITLSAANYNYIFFWDKNNTYLGYQRTASGVHTTGSYLGVAATPILPPTGTKKFALMAKTEWGYLSNNDDDYIDLLLSNQVYEETMPNSNLDFKTFFEDTLIVNESSDLLPFNQPDYTEGYAFTINNNTITIDGYVPANTFITLASYDGAYYAGSVNIDYISGTRIANNIDISTPVTGIALNDVSVMDNEVFSTAFSYYNIYFNIYDNTYFSNYTFELYIYDYYTPTREHITDDYWYFGSHDYDFSAIFTDNSVTLNGTASSDIDLILNDIGYDGNFYIEYIAPDTSGGYPIDFQKPTSPRLYDNDTSLYDIIITGDITGDFGELILDINAGSEFNNNTYTINAYSYYPLRILDTPVYEELSLRDIFEDGDIGYYELPNGVKTFEISGNDLVQRVETHTLISSDIFTLNTGSFVDIDLVFIKKNIDYITYNKLTPNENNSSILTYVYSLDNIDNLNDVGQFSIGQQLLYYIIGIDKGTYASLTEVQNVFTGTILYYQLSTPIVLHTFTTAPTQSQLDDWLAEYLAIIDSDFIYNINAMLPYYNETYNYNMSETEFAYWEQLYIDYIFTVDRYEWYNDTGFITAENYDFWRTEYELWKGVNADFHLFSSFDDITIDYTVSVSLPTDIDDNLDNGIESFGLGNFGRFLILFVIIGAISLLLGLIHVPYSMILLVDILLFMTSFLLDWIPAWLGIITVIVLFITLITVVIRRN